MCRIWILCGFSNTSHVPTTEWHGEFHFAKRVMSIYSSIRKYIQHENWGFVVAPGSCNAIYSSCSETPEAVALSCLSFITLHKLSFRTERRGGVRNVNIKQSGQWYLYGNIHFQTQTSVFLPVLDSCQTLLGFVHSVVHSSCLHHCYSGTTENVTISILAKKDYFKTSKR